MAIAFHRTSPPAPTRAPSPIHGDTGTYDRWGITALPRELVVKILANLGSKDLVVCQRVTRKWKDIVDTTPILPQALYRRLRPLAPVPESLATVEYSYPSIRHVLERFSEQGRTLALELDEYARGRARLFPERLFFSLARLLAEAPVLDCQKAYTIQHTHPIRKIRISPDGQYVVTSSEDNTAKICARIDGQWQEITTLVHPDKVLDAYFSPTGDYCVTSCINRTFQLWEVRGIAGPRKNPVHLPHDSLVCLPCFSADSNYLVTLPTPRTTKILQRVNE